MQKGISLSRRSTKQIKKASLLYADWIFPYGVRGGAGHEVQAGAFDSEGSRAGVWAVPEAARTRRAEGETITTGGQHLGMNFK